MLVLDGGALVHRVTWGKDVTVQDIIDMYKHYIQSRYKSFSSVTVVFDDYIVKFYERSLS